MNLEKHAYLLMSSDSHPYPSSSMIKYSTKKREHSVDILKAFIVRQSSEYETSDHVYPHLAIYFSSPFGRYPTFHTLTSVGRKELSVC